MEDRGGSGGPNGSLGIEGMGKGKGKEVSRRTAFSFPFPVPFPDIPCAGVCGEGAPPLPSRPRSRFVQLQRTGQVYVADFTIDPSESVAWNTTFVPVGALRPAAHAPHER